MSKSILTVDCRESVYGRVGMNMMLTDRVLEFERKLGNLLMAMGGVWVGAGVWMR